MSNFYDERLDGNVMDNDYGFSIMKRSGERVPYDRRKIANAIRGANNDEGLIENRLSEEQIESIVSGIEKNICRMNRDISVEEIQDMVETALMKVNQRVAKLFITYRYEHQNARKMSTLDKKIAGILDFKNEEVKQENSNKNPVILSVQRDYMAGEWSRYFTNKELLPPDIVQAHNEGILHFHDSDYFAQKMSNCCLVNLEDMLQNGTMISGTKIDKPKSFATACTVASQVVSQVASSQFGGQTITLAHLAPFVDVSRQKIRKRLKQEFETVGIDATDEKINSLAERELIKEVEAGCQTIQYQLITLQSTNGQAPFVTVFMYLGEVPEGQIKEDLALLIKVMLEQRILGVKDKSGTYITPAFPKLIYCLEQRMPRIPPLLSTVKVAGQAAFDFVRMMQN